MGIARYLQRSQIVQSSEDYRIALRPGEWWGEPLDAMLARVLAEDLTLRLPQSTIYTSSGAVTGSPEATIEIEVQRLDLDRDGNLLLIAQGSVSFKNPSCARYAQLPHIGATAVARGRGPGGGYEYGAWRIGGPHWRHACCQIRPKMSSPSTAEITTERTNAALRECPGCGLFQMEPALAPGTTAQCERCGTTLRKARTHPLEHSMALAVAAVILLIVMCLTTLMTVRTSGIVHQAGIFSGPAELLQRGMSGLAIVVIFVTVAAPFAKLLGTIYVLLCIRKTNPPRHLRRIFALVERLSTWSMTEVFVLGVFVAYAKLGDLVKIELDAGVYALLALTFVLVWADGSLDREAIWDALDSGRAREMARRALITGRVPPGAIGCETCTLVVVPDEPDELALAAVPLCMPANRTALPGPGHC